MQSRPLPSTLVTSQEEKSQYGIKDLSRLVKANDFNGIKQVIANAEKAIIQKHGENSGISWTLEDNDHYIPNAMRDAILLGYHDIVNYFLENGVNPNCWAHLAETSTELRQPIYFAVVKNNLHLVELFLKYGALVSPGDSNSDFKIQIDNNTAIETAIAHGYYDIAKCLLEHGATSKGYIFFRDKSKEVSTIYFLAYAVRISRIDLVELLIKHGANIPDTLGDNLFCFNQKNRWIEDNITGENRSELLEYKKALFEAYRSSTFTLMDYAFGVDFISLNFLKSPKEIDISGMNFVGASVQGIPITHEMLKNLELKGAENAITTIQDMPDITASSLTNTGLSSSISRLIHAFNKHAGTIDEKTGIINLVPLWKAVEKGDVECVKARLKSKDANPNLGEPDYPFPNIITESIPLNRALQNKSYDIAKLLMRHPLFDFKSIDTVIDYSNKSGQVEAVNFLRTYQVNLQMTALSMGMHPRLGEKSPIYTFFGASAYNKNPDGTDTMHPDRNVLKITKEFLM